MSNVNIILVLSGDLERLQNFWLTGACSLDSNSQSSGSSPLGVENFLSTFFLLAVGIVKFGQFRLIVKFISNPIKGSWPCVLGLRILLLQPFARAIEKAGQEWMVWNNQHGKWVCANA
jgi:hypothetical protein